MADPLRDILDEQEETQLQAFYDNEPMREAVKKVLLMFLYNNGVPKKGDKHDPTVNYAFIKVANDSSVEDEVVGRHLKVLWEAICLVETAFSNIATFKKIENLKVDEKNTAR